MQQYRNDKIIVRYDETICTHSGHCVKHLPGVFDINKDPWINVNGGDIDAIKKTISQCPSGALSYEATQMKQKEQQGDRK